ncbi:class I SAM-dependent methyltransferase [Gaoshiqia sediminis]|uniref:Class I SAM-dependent methyltransferase n=1 Tax=Gaoshiqia sediminis TaxID=2986998 RepID=A0AA41Y7Y3_9BACT|nr:class I SAM-dependent methyltransferase [Gaoshiqia sediminis]MCW0483161.1 class I SAM-dependent methyltransferase [Gaoshiqia sediminis]
MKVLNKCNFCKSPLNHLVVDLGMQPLCEDRIKPESLNQMEPHFPLKAFVCNKCFLVQVPESASPQVIYRDYGYYSSFSDTWLEHARKYVHLAIKRFSIDKNNLVAEIASNDGYLLQYFAEKGIPVLGIDPAEAVAQYAIKEKGIRTEILFFGVETAKYLVKTYGQADLIIGNNILAHVPDINDFVQGMKLFLKPGGVITMEFPHLQRLIEGNQFDTIYHEHFSYLSFSTVSEIFQEHGLDLFDVEELPTHGGSIRIYAHHAEDTSKSVQQAVPDLLKREESLGMRDLTYYESFNEKVKETKRKILEFLIQAKRDGKHIAGYGAPGKGNTLLNYCGIRTDFLDYTVDRSPFKQGNYLPGTHIPVFPPDILKKTKPDYVFILPWNLKDEIISHHQYIRDWGGKFVVPIPELTIID